MATQEAAAQKPEKYRVDAVGKPWVQIYTYLQKLATVFLSVSDIILSKQIFAISS